MMFRKFIARRGIPHKMLSDNQLSFQSASAIFMAIYKALTSAKTKDFCAKYGISWSFIPALSPWWGGAHESLVKVVKNALKKTFEKRIYSVEEMSTLLAEAEAVTNTRPLTFLGSDISDGVAICPADLLLPNRLNIFPEIPEPENNFEPKPDPEKEIVKIWRQNQKRVDHFWQLFSRDYLLSLREIAKNSHPNKGKATNLTPKIGNIVLVRPSSEIAPRGTWKMAKIVGFRTSRDGLIRVARVRFATGNVVERPLDLLHPLECGQVDEKQEPSDLPPPTTPVTTRKTINADRAHLKRPAAERARQEWQRLLNLDRI